MLRNYASVMFLICQTKQAMEKNKNSKLWELCDGKIDNVNGKTVFECQGLKNKSAITVVNKYIAYLAEEWIARPLYSIVRLWVVSVMILLQRVGDSQTLLFL